MTDIYIPPLRRTLSFVWKKQRVWMASLAILLILYFVDANQALQSLDFTISAITTTAPNLVLSISVAAWAGATGADSLIARAFRGTPFVMILFAALAGGLSPFCSCGVIPLVAALLSMGVPLSAVMAFWLASPIMDPSMFILTSGVLGYEFAIAKTLSAVGLGIAGGMIVLVLSKGGWMNSALKEGVGDGGCAASKARIFKPVVWAF